MGIFNWINEQARVNRAGKLRQNKSELEELKAKECKSEEDLKRIKKLNNSIGKDEERQKIANEKATKAQIINKNKTTYKQTTNDINAQVNYKGNQTIGDTKQSCIQNMESAKIQPKKHKKSK